MRKTGLFLYSLIALTAAFPNAAQADDIDYTATDGTKVFATVNHTEQSGSPLVILFHQAGSNGRAEYANIAPRLIKEGYSVMMVDQRSGGNRFGAENRTASQFPEGQSYCSAYPDMLASLDYAKKAYPDQPIITWGSSYSAGLLVSLLVDHGDDLAAGVAFSPYAGAGVADCAPNQKIRDMKASMLALRPASEMKRPSSQYQFDLFTASGHSVFVAEKGVHGASMLDKTRTDAPTKDTWKVVLDFMKDAVKDYRNSKSENSPTSKEKSSDTQND